MIIYMIQNLVNGKKYVGQTHQSLEQRFAQHKYANSLIGRAIRKYGEENFHCGVIEHCTTQEQLDERERYWIAKLRCISPNGYNLREGGAGDGYPST